MTSHEHDLVRRFQQGMPGAFDAMYAAYGDRIYRFCYRLCGHAADAEDLAQDVFLAAFQGLARFEGRSSVATWLYRIALYRWQRLHGGQRPETLAITEELEVAATAPDPAFVSMERLSLDHAVAALAPALREAFLLVKVEGLKYREAAAALGIPQGTVQSRVHDATMRLRELLAGELEEPAFRPAPSIACPLRGGLNHEL
jgi:RNA polymerase sigma-70 factor, ECF subfamily